MPWGKPQKGQTETSTDWGWVTFKDKTNDRGEVTDTLISRGTSRDVDRGDHAHAWDQDKGRDGAGHRNDTTGVLKDGGKASEPPRR